MRDSTAKRIRKVFEDGNGFARTSELLDSGAQMRQITELIKAGKIIRIKNGLYNWQELTEGKDIIYRIASLIVPKGIICLGTALAYHRLTTDNPWEISMAVPRNYAVKLADYPPIRTYAFNERMYGTGIDVIGEGKGGFRIYDKEKTICDVTKFEKYIGRNAAIEAVRTYVNGSSRNFDLLMRYAKICGVVKKLEIRIAMLL